MIRGPGDTEIVATFNFYNCYSYNCGFDDDIDGDYDYGIIMSLHHTREQN